MSKKISAQFKHTKTPKPKIEQLKLGKPKQQFKRTPKEFAEAPIIDLKWRIYNNIPLLTKDYKSLRLAKWIVASEKKDNLRQLINDILEYGGVHIVAKKGYGKTNTQKVLAQRFMANKNKVVIIFDTTFKFRQDFESIPYITIEDRDIHSTVYKGIDFKKATEKMDKPYWRNISKWQMIRKMLFGFKLSEKSTYPQKSIIFDIRLTEPDDIGTFVYLIVSMIDEEQRRQGINNQKDIVNHYIYFIDECQNVFGERAGIKNIFKKMMKIFSEARNFNESFVTSSQRLQEVSTKIRAKMNYYLYGRISREDIYLKMARMVKYGDTKRKKEEIIESLLTLPVGKFLYYDKNEVKMTQFPLYKRKSLDKPINLWLRYLKRQRKKLEKRIKIEQKKKTMIQKKPSLWQKIKSLWNIVFWNKATQNKPKEPKEPQNEEEEAEEDTAFGMPIDMLEEENESS